MDEKQMLDLATRHAQYEAEQKIGPLMEPLVPEPEYGFYPANLRMHRGAVRVGGELDGGLRRRLLGHAHTGTRLLERRGDSWSASAHGASRRTKNG